MRTLHWTARARTDLADCDAFYRPLSAEYAQLALRSASKAGEFLSEYPQAGSAMRQRGLRKWRVPGTPLLLLYRHSPAAITVTRVARNAQNRDKW